MPPQWRNAGLLLTIIFLTSLVRGDDTPPNFVIVFADISPSDRVGFDEPFLVDLQRDLGETSNVAAEHPDVVNRLLQLAERMRADLGDYDRVGEHMRFFDPYEQRPTSPPVPPPGGAKKMKKADKTRQ